jgi:hypothetical protein
MPAQAIASNSTALGAFLSGRNMSLRASAFCERNNLLHDNGVASSLRSSQRHASFLGAPGGSPVQETLEPEKPSWNYVTFVVNLPKLRDLRARHGELPVALTDPSADRCDLSAAWLPLFQWGQENHQQGK